MIPYKNRTLDRTKPVSVYRNLNRRGRWYSIVQDGLVVAHSQLVKLKDCTFHINEAGRQRVLESGTKNVHARVKGMLVRSTPHDIEQPLSYSPFSCASFMGPFGKVDTAKYVTLGLSQRFISNEDFFNSCYQRFGHLFNLPFERRHTKVKPKSIYGHGTNDATYKVRQGGRQNPSKCKLFTYWENRVRNVYSAAQHERSPQYRNTYLSEEWHKFSGFLIDFLPALDKVPPQFREGIHIDKDILNVGYCREGFLLVPQNLNKFMKMSSKNTKGYVGAVLARGRYRAEINGRYLGSFNTELEAHRVWYKEKQKCIVNYRLPPWWEKDKQARVRVAMLSRLNEVLETEF